MLLDRLRPRRSLIFAAVLVGSIAPTTTAADSASWERPAEFEVVVVDTSTPVPQVRSEQMSSSEYSSMLRDGDPDTGVSRQASFTPLAPLAVDPIRDRQWQLDEIGVDDVWAMGITGAGVTIGVVDTGVVAQDVHLVSAADFTGGSPGLFEHGTTVASIAAATRGNGVGGSGVAPDAAVVSAKVCSGGSCASDDIARGIVWVVGQGADVINISLGGPASAAVRQTIDWAVAQGVVVIAAAGNSSCSVGSSAGCDPTVDNVSYPAAFPNVIAVTATDANGESPAWTSKGRRSTVAAPGAALWYSTDGLFGASGSGTSFASPVVAGIVALMLEARPTLTPTEVQAALMLSAIPSAAPLIEPTVPRPWYYGAGDVDALGAVTLASVIADAQLAAPTVVSGDRSLTVSWPAVAGATSYTIANSPGGSIASTSTSVALTGLENGRTYAVSVTADTPSGAQLLEPSLGVPSSTMVMPSLSSVSASTNGTGRVYAWFDSPPTNVDAAATLNGLSLGSSVIGESPASSGNFYASWPTTSLVSNGSLEVWFETGLGATSPRATATLSVTRLLRAPPNVNSSTIGGITTITWNSSTVAGGSYDGANATGYVVSVYGFRRSTGTYDTREGLSTTSTSLQLSLFEGVTYAVYIAALHSPTGTQSDWYSTTVVDRPAPLPALEHPTVTANGDNVTIGFDTQTAADAILLTSSGQVPFVVGTPQASGAGRSQVTVSLATLALVAGDAARLCVAGAEYFDGTAAAQYGAWSTGVSFVAGSDAGSDGDSCVADAPSGTTPATTAPPTTVPTTVPTTAPTTVPTTTSPSPTTSDPPGTAAPPERFDPITPERLADTRSGAASGAAFGGRVLAGATLRVPIAGRGAIDPRASAVAANITAVDADSSGFLTVWPCGVTRPLVASVNYTRGSVDANAVLVGLGGPSGGELCVYALSTVDVVIDVTGVFVGSSRAFEPVAPARVIDTRLDGRRLAAGGSISFTVAGSNGVPTGATAATLNVTAVDPGAAGFVTVWPCGSSRPTTSNLNVMAGDTRPNLVTVKLGDGGQVCAFSQSDVDLVVDVNGWWGSSGRYAYTPTEPFRLVDTRVSPGFTRLPAGATLRVRATGVGGVPSNARAVAANITVVDPAAAGFVTAWPCNERPLASSGNYRAGAVRPNAAAVAVSDAGELCVFTQSATDVVIDITGFWI